MSDFVAGLVLCQHFYVEIVRPLLAAHFPQLAYAAARINTGSEVLGFDTPMSTDHDWGPSVQLLLQDADAALIPNIDAMLNAHLPPSFMGYAVRFVKTPNDGDTSIPAPDDARDTYHLIRPATLRHYISDHFGLSLDAPLTPADWLSFPSQKLLTFTAGAVFEDMTDELTALRQRLAWYPHDIWLYVLAAGWTRLAQEEHLMPRAGYVGDALGSALIGSRLVRDCMSLCFLMERRYAPYAKWFGTAFQHLASAATLTPLLWKAQQAETWQTRMETLAQIYQHLVEMHNALDITPPLDSTPTPFFTRPFTVIKAERIADALIAAISDPVVRAIATRHRIGTIDQFSDSADLRAESRYQKIIAGLYTLP